MGPRKFSFVFASVGEFHTSLSPNLYRRVQYWCPLCAQFSDFPLTRPPIQALQLALYNNSVLLVNDLQVASDTLQSQETGNPALSDM